MHKTTLQSKTLNSLSNKLMTIYLNLINEFKNDILDEVEVDFRNKGMFFDKNRVFKDEIALQFFGFESEI